MKIASHNSNDNPFSGTLPKWFFFLGCVSFWVSRYWYWSITEELPFSDMADFDSTARTILSSFCFDFNSFFRGYNVPTVPALRAIQIFLLGDSMRGWQLFQAALLFVGMLWLSRELLLSTRSRWLVVVFLWTFVLSKSSLFWSLKLAREGVGEAFTVLVSAAIMNMRRTRTVNTHLVAGGLFAAAMLVRGSFIFALPLVACLVLVRDFSLLRKDYLKSLALKGSCLFIIGLLAVWGPWVFRSYRLYGHPVLLSTVGPYVFFWDLGEVRVRAESGDEIVFSTNTLQTEAYTKFHNDYEAFQYSKKLMGLYVRQNLQKLPALFASRVVRTITDRDVHLTKVSRFDLFPGTSFDEDVLRDKSMAVVVLGLTGLVALSIVYGSASLAVLFLLTFIPWINAAIMIGYARMLESFISLLLFGQVALVFCICRVTLGHLRRFKTLEMRE
jgi:hypothetical protein